MSLLAINLSPSKKQLRSFGIAGCVIMLLLGGWVFWKHTIFGIPLCPDGTRIVSTSLWISSGVLLALTIVPSALLPLYIVLSVVGWPIGLTISTVIMFVIYFIFLTPLALIFRLIGRDALKRRLQADADTYWIPVSDKPDAGWYFRQF